MVASPVLVVGGLHLALLLIKSQELCVLRICVKYFIEESVSCIFTAHSLKPKMIRDGSVRSIGASPCNCAVFDRLI